MKKIKLFLYKIFGLKTYLKIVSSVYICLIKKGFLKNQYPEIHYLKNLIKEGDTCIDIGANIGYYSVFMSQYAGHIGKIYAVEPVGVFAEVWRRNVKKSHIDNLIMLPYALGSEEKKIEMGMPKVEGEIHHGMTKILSKSEEICEKKFQVEMRIPDNLFAEIEKIDFIKIDVEGYESIVFENLTKTLEKHSPIIQGEMGGTENRKKCIEILSKYNYKYYKLQNEKLSEITEKEALIIPEDIYFLK